HLVDLAPMGGGGAARAFGRRHARRRHRAEAARCRRPSAGFGLPWVERHDGGCIPLSRATTPAGGVPLLGSLIHGATVGEDREVRAAMTLVGGHEADGAVEMLVVVPG